MSGLRDWIRGATAVHGSASAKPLTRGMLDAAFEQIKNAPPHPCSLGRHVVSPKVYREGGWTRCANCGGLVDVPPHPVGSSSGEGE